MWRPSILSLKWPKWLNLAIGYGSNGLIGGDDNIYTSNGIDYDRSDIERYRQFYLAPDLDLSQIEVSNKWLKAGLIVLNCIKFPTPALEYNQQGQFKFHYLTL